MLLLKIFITLFDFSCDVSFVYSNKIYLKKKNLNFYLLIINLVHFKIYLNLLKPLVFKEFTYIFPNLQINIDHIQGFHQKLIIFPKI